MPYEARIGWRYLHRGRPSPVAILGFVGSMLATVLGAIVVMLFNPGPIPSTLLAVAPLAMLVFGLACIFRVFTAVSIIGVVIGVSELILVMGVTSGFQAQFREKVLGVNAHVLVMKSTQDFANYRDVEQTALSLQPDVVAVQPFVFVEMLVTRGKGELSAVAIKGVDPNRVGTVLDLPKHMIEGDIGVLKSHPEGTPPPIIVGKELAHKLKAKIGDDVTVVSPLSNIDVKTWSPSNAPPKTRKFRIQGIFYSGFDEYDRRLMYVDIKEAQDFLEQGDVVMGVEMKLRDVSRAKYVARKLEKKLGGDPYVVMDWRELNNNLFTALTLQKVAMLLFLTLLIVVAAFNIVAALTMMVLDKTKEIAILKSMGANSLGVMGVFQTVGLVIGGVGTVLGLGYGLLLCFVVAKFGYPLDPKVYLIDRLPIRVDPLEVAMVGGITLVICLLATLYPALKASSLRPVDGLRYE
jgi:lipoprotein-releasing system permease protein